MRHYAGSALMLIITMAAAIGSYTVNLRVSSERAAVNQLRKQLVADAREIRTLQVELRTRARLPEMQRWNDGVFQMSAPAASQYLRSSVQLASYGAAPEPAKPNLQYAVTGPATVTVPASDVVTAAYSPSVPVTTPDAARLIRAGYTAAPKADRFGDDPAATLMATPPSRPSIITVAAASPAKRVALLDAPARPRTATARPAAFVAVAKPVPALSAALGAGPANLLPEGGQ